MAALLPIDGARRLGGGLGLRAALTLAAVTGQGFEMTRIRAGRPRPGLDAQQLATLRALTLASGARVGGAFDGSPDLRFEPGPVAPGAFEFELATAGATSLLLQALLPVLATADTPSQVSVTGGTHVPHSPSYEYLARHWSDVVRRLGLSVRLELERVGFFPAGGGKVRGEALGFARPASLVLEERGSLVAVRGVSGAGRVKGDVAKRQRDAAQARLWEARRFDTLWEVIEPASGSPGSFLFLEAEFERGRGAFAFLGERGVRPERLGDRAARTLLKFLDAEGAVDPRLADQLVVPIALAGGGGRVSTSELTPQLETVVALATLFGIRARTWGRRGGPGGFEIERV